MAKGVDVFTLEQFEAALPVSTKTGKPLWHKEGFVEGEYCYSIRVNEDVWIQIRSSVKEDGMSARTGKDSIRAWLTDGDNNPLGTKLQAYITRLPGWEGRLLEVCRKLWLRAVQLEMCPTCNRPMGVFAQKKPGPNKGRLFTKCFEHGHFRWLDSKKSEKTYKQLTPWTVEEMRDSLKSVELIRNKVELIRSLVETDDEFMVAGLLFIYERQTAEEQSVGETIVHNKIGFSGVDAEILTSFSKQFMAKKFLSYKQLTLTRRKVVKYAKQIERELR